MFSFTVPANLKIGEAASKGEASIGRHALYGVVAVRGTGDDQDQAYLIASDGSVLATVPVVHGEGEIERPVLLPAKATIAGAQDQTVAITEAEARVTTGIGMKAKSALHGMPDQDGRYPDITGIYKSAYQSVRLLKAAEATEEEPSALDKAREPKAETKGNTYAGLALTLNANKLASVARAISPIGQVTIFIPPAAKNEAAVGSPLLLVGNDDDGRAIGIGLIMPMQTEKALVEKRRKFFRNMVDALPTGGFKFGKDQPAYPPRTAKAEAKPETETPPATPPAETIPAPEAVANAPAETETPAAETVPATEPAIAPTPEATKVKKPRKVKDAVLDTVELAPYGQRWQQGEKITAIAKELGVSWNLLWSALSKKGYQPKKAS